MVSGFSANRVRLDNGRVSSTVSFLFVSFMLLSSIGYLYTYMVFKNPSMINHGCQEDGEGSWAIGVFYGDSPFSLKPIEDMNVWDNMSSSWPVANPVVTCELVSESGFPSNFVADPFLYVQGDVIYMFFETKNSITMQGDIGAARSIDNGASWQHIGVVLDEEWHLSYPFVFDYDDIYDARIDDIIMSCDHIERGFKVWRENPDRLVGFYPRLVNWPGPLEYRGEKHARKYNMILTGAAFMDHRLAFDRYWSEDAEAGREVVDEVFNCEDVLMNFLYANATFSRTSVEYVKPAWTIDTSKLPGVAISENTQAHYRVRSNCLEMFAALYGGISDRKVEFRRRRDRWDQ